MSAPTPENTLPANSALAYSYEYAIDVDISDGTGDPIWQRVRFIHSLDPQSSPVTVEAGTYEDLGSPSPRKTSESWTASFYVQNHSVDGVFLPEIAALWAASEPDATGRDAEIGVRWYDNPAPGTRSPVLEDSYSGIATVSMTRAATGASGEVAGWNVTLTGIGRRAKALHPATPPTP